jgi:two-component system, NtrC family, nitrogen regulation sensor histidine kinase NtrY
LKPFLRNRLFLQLGLLLAAIVLFALSFIFNRLYTNRSAVTDEIDIAERYISRQQRDFNRFLEDTSLIRKLVDNSASLNEYNRVVEKSYGIFLYKVSQHGLLSISFWNNQAILPPPKTYSSGDLEEVMALSNGYYLVVKKSLNIASRTVVAYALIPIHSDFFLETEYMEDKFVFSPSAESRVKITMQTTAFPVRSLSGKTIFHFERKTTTAVPYNSKLTIVLRLTALLLLLLFVHLVAETLARQKIWKGILFLGLALLALRLLIYWLPALMNFRQFELFDPSIYGANVVQRSLGDLLMNSIFFCWFVLFTWYKVHHKPSVFLRFPLWVQWSAGVIAVCMLIYSTFILSSLIRSIVADSKISFDVTNFYSLDKYYTTVGFIVLACLSLSYYYFTQLLFRIIFPLFKGNPWPVYFAIGFSGLVYLTIKSGDPTVLFYLPVLAWLLLYTWVVSREGMVLYRLRINIAGIIFWIFVFSVSIAAIMLAENRKAEWEKRKFYAGKLADQTDASSERLMSIALKYLDNDFVENNFHRFSDSLMSKQLRDSILSGNYQVYLSKFGTRLYLYDSTGLPLYNPDNTTYDALNTIVTLQSHPTGTTDLFYFETGFDKFTYITKRVISDTAGRTLGYFFIISNPKKYSSEGLFPELFKQYKENSPENSPIYSYAVYSQGKLILASYKYPFITRLDEKQRPKSEYERKNNEDYDELWYRAGNDKVVVIARKRDTIIETITLFSYIFCSFLFLVFIVQVLSLIVKAVIDPDGFRRFFHFNIRNQVHSTIIFISIFSFIIIGIATINFFKSRYNRNNSDRLSRTMNVMVKEMQKRIGADSTSGDRLIIADTSSVTLQRLVDDVSDIHGVDVNVYDLNGDLQVSSETNVYARGILSEKMHPLAYYHLSRLNQVEHVQEESIADLPYLSVYAPVRDNEGRAYAYLSIPYFTSQPELNQEISNFIVTVINLNAFILLIAGLIALFITNRITRSFSVISDKMKDVNLGRLNEEIVWNRNDEIGDLVTEYNKMVAKLGASAEALAKTEREGAWREMARQVAHEIKNPLTPMKLSIQYLQKSIDSNQPNVKELSGTVAQTLVEQIDHLSKIAADFSQFANIGNITVEEFDLHDVLRSLVELFKSDPNIEFAWLPVQRSIIVNADKTQMNRLFTNLIANAIEACKGIKCRIEVSEQVNDNGFVRISVKDNGEGIDPAMQSRIFIPNFTTKSSGTGLGLAMCKSIVEQTNGKIWFETEKGVGTIFHVEIPLAY